MFGGVLSGFLSLLSLPAFARAASGILHHHPPLCLCGRRLFSGFLWCPVSRRLVPLALQSPANSLLCEGVAPKS